MAAAYVTCLKNAVGISDKERSKKDRVRIQIQIPLFGI